MIWYVIASAILLIFFELIGRYFLYVLKIENFKFCFGIGLIAFLAYSYITTSIIGALNGSFFLLCIIYSAFFICSIILITKNIRKISFKIDNFDLLLLMVAIIFMTLYAYNTTLGSLDGFDSTFYLNFITSNIKTVNLNQAFFSSSMEPSFLDKQYTFQTYNYFASYISYIFASIINLFHKTYYQTVYIWVFQIIFNAFYFSLIINSINIMNNKKNRIVSIIILLFFILTYGRIYYYNVLGFYGNAYRIVTVGYSSLVLYLMAKQSNNNGILCLFVCSLLASASVSSSGLFIDMFIIFGSYFILRNRYQKLLKYYGFTLFFILNNLLTISLGFSIFKSICFSLVVCLPLFFCGDKLNEILSKKRVLIVILILSFTIMFGLSLATTKNLFDFSAFFDNVSEWADMTINYYKLDPSQTLFYLKLFVVILLLMSLFMIKKESYIQFILILFVCIFNPFCCSFLFKILRVYYRAFDIIVNPFTIILYIDFILGYLKKYQILQISFLLIIVFVSLQNRPTKPLYYHESFDPGIEYKGMEYNNEFKMSKSDIEVVDAMYNDSLYYNLDNPYVVTPNLLTQSFIPQGRFLFTRYTYSGCPYTTDSEKQLFAIFYPERYPGDDKVKYIEPEYNNISEFINDAKIDYLVVDKTKEYYDSNTNKYSYLFYKVLENFYPMFENDRYIVIRCFYQ